eukprot:17036-Pelagococcus_subviridis.AAC.1
MSATTRRLGYSSGWSASRRQGMLFSSSSCPRRPDLSSSPSFYSTRRLFRSLSSASAAAATANAAAASASIPSGGRSHSPIASLARRAARSSRVSRGGGGGGGGFSTFAPPPHTTARRNACARISTPAAATETFALDAARSAGAGFDHGSHAGESQFFASDASRSTDDIANVAGSVADVVMRRHDARRVCDPLAGHIASSGSAASIARSSVRAAAIAAPGPVGSEFSAPTGRGGFHAPSSGGGGGTATTASMGGSGGASGFVFFFVAPGCPSSAVRPKSPSAGGVAVAVASPSPGFAASSSPDSTDGGFGPSTRGAPNRRCSSLHRLPSLSPFSFSDAASTPHIDSSGGLSAYSPPPPPPLEGPGVFASAFASATSSSSSIVTSTSPPSSKESSTPSVDFLFFFFAAELVATPPNPPMLKPSPPPAPEGCLPTRPQLPMSQYAASSRSTPR